MPPLIAWSSTVLALSVSVLSCSDDAALVDGAGGFSASEYPQGVSVNVTSSARTSATTGANASASTGAVADSRLQPLEVGRSWTYTVTSTYPSCPAGTRTSAVTGTTTIEGRSAFVVTSICGDEVAMSVEGDVVESKYQSYPWLRLLDEPVVDGHTWTTSNGSATFGMRYASVGSVTTPAGTFSDCWRVTQEVSYTQTWTYCRGVGQVASELVDLAGGTISYTLAAKSF